MFQFLSRILDSHNDESFRKQLADIPPAMLQLAIAGGNCDQTPQGSGPFGELCNPIPVNGPRGEIKYINRLICPCNHPLIAHRLGSLRPDAAPRQCRRDATIGVAFSGPQNGYDVYEVVCSEGRHWSVWYFDMYYASRSHRAPTGYRFSDFHPTFSRTHIGLVTNKYCPDFPHAMKTFPSQLGIAQVMQRAVVDKIGYKLEHRQAFHRTDDHVNKLHVLAHVVQFTGTIPSC
jgi:hypothetical protein